MKTTSKRQAHTLCLVASSGNHEAATGADVYLEIDGKEFEANFVEIEAGAGTDIVYATVKFAIKELKVSVQAEAKVDQVDGVTDSVRNITIDTAALKVDAFTKDSEGNIVPDTTYPQLLMGLDFKPVITEPITESNPVVSKDKATSETLNSLYIQAEAGEPVYAYLRCNPFKKSFGEKYPLAKLNIEKLVEENDQLSD